jgi:hypothetical protein
MPHRLAAALLLLLLPLAHGIVVAQARTVSGCLVVRRMAIGMCSEQHPTLDDSKEDSKEDSEQAATPPLSLDAEFEAGLENGKQIIARFLRPQIDDPGLPYADSLVCVCGSLFVASAALKGLIPQPGWLLPFLPAGVAPLRGLPYIVPAVAHGAGLATCWTLGALAAAAFESGAFTGTLGEALGRTWRAGAFATGCLILGTQMETYVSLVSRGIDPLAPSYEADVAALSHAFEIASDVAVQATGLTAFRVFRWWDAQERRF